MARPSENLYISIGEWKKPLKQILYSSLSLSFLIFHLANQKTDYISEAKIFKNDN